MGFGIEQNGSCDTSYKSLLGNTNIDKTFGSGNEKDKFESIRQLKVVEEGSRLDRLYKRKTEKLQEIK